MIFFHSSTDESSSLSLDMDPGSPEVNSKMEHPRLQFNLVQNTQIVQYLIDNAQTIFQSDPHENLSPALKQNQHQNGFHSLNCDFTSSTDLSLQKSNPLSKR